MFDLSQWINLEVINQLFEFCSSGLIFGIFLGFVGFMLGLVIYSGIMCFK